VNYRLNGPWPAETEPCDEGGWSGVVGSMYQVEIPLFPKLYLAITLLDYILGLEEIE